MLGMKRNEMNFGDCCGWRGGRVSHSKFSDRNFNFHLIDTLPLPENLPGQDGKCV